MSVAADSLSVRVWRVSTVGESAFGERSANQLRSVSQGGGALALRYAAREGALAD